MDISAKYLAPTLSELQLLLAEKTLGTLIVKYQLKPFPVTIYDGPPNGLGSELCPSTQPCLVEGRAWWCRASAADVRHVQGCLSTSLMAGTQGLEDPLTQMPSLQEPRKYVLLPTLRPGFLVGTAHRVSCLGLSGPASSHSRKVL